MIILPLCSPYCKLRLARFSAELNPQDGPSVAMETKNMNNNSNIMLVTEEQLLNTLLLNFSP